MRASDPGILFGEKPAWRYWIAFYLALLAVCAGSVSIASTSSDYRIFHDVLDAGGRSAISADFSSSGSLGGLGGGVATIGSDVTDRNGFAGQLNSPPTPAGDTFKITVSASGSITNAVLLSNDTDADGDSLSVVEISILPGEVGSLESATDGVRYVPPPDFVGEVTLLYKVSDGSDGVASGRITILVGRITPMVVWADPAQIVYGATLTTNQLNATANVPGSFVYEPPLDTLLPAGNAHSLGVTFTPADTNGYEVVQASASLNVARATLTITAINTARLFGAENPALTHTITGFVNNEDSGVLSGVPALHTGATGASPIGDYPIVISAGTLNAANYDFTFVDGILAVMAAGTDGPLIQGTTSAVISITDKQTAKPFSGVTLVNPTQPAQSFTTTLTLDNALKGHLTQPGGFTEGPLGRYIFSGNAATATATLRGLVFRPAENRVLVGAAETTTFTITVTDGVHSPVSDAQTKVAATSVNDVPTVSGLSLERLENKTVKVTVEKLLALAYDPDPDPLALASVSSPSAHGATVEIDGAWVIYIPPVGFNQTDTFDYTIDDGHGAVVKGTVTVLVRPPDNSPTKNIIAMIPESGGVVRLTFIGISGRAYAIEATSSLSPPVWVRLATRTAGSNGIFDYVDSDAPGFPERYYRAIQP